MEISDLSSVRLQETPRVAAPATVEPAAPPVAPEPGLALPPGAPEDLRYNAELHDSLKRLNDDSRVSLPEPDGVESPAAPESSTAPPQPATADERTTELLEAPESEPSEGEPEPVEPPSAPPAPLISGLEVPDWRAALQQSREATSAALQQQIQSLTVQAPAPPEPTQPALVGDEPSALRQSLEQQGFDSAALDEVLQGEPREQGEKIAQMLMQQGKGPEEIGEFFLQQLPSDLQGELRLAAPVLTRLAQETGLEPEALLLIAGHSEGPQRLLEHLRGQGVSEAEISALLQAVDSGPEPDLGDALLGGLREAGLDDDDMARIGLLPPDEQSNALLERLLEKGMDSDKALQLMAGLPTLEDGPSLRVSQALAELEAHGISQQDLRALTEGPEEERQQRLESLLQDKGLSDLQLEQILAGMAPPSSPLESADPEAQARAQSFVDALEKRGLSKEEIAGFVGENRTEELIQRLKDGGASQAEVDQLFQELIGAQVENAQAGVLTQQEAELIGKDLKGRGPQTFWVERSLDTVAQRATEQGRLSSEDQARHRQATSQLFAGQAQSTPDGGRSEMPPAVLAALARDSGLALEKLDPNQLMSATRFINGATSLSDQQERAAKVLDNLKVLETGKLPQLELNDVKGILWDMARVGGHSLDNIKDKPQDLQRAFEEIAGGFNAGPGDYKTKVGKHDIKFSVSQASDYIEGSGSTKGPGFWGTVGPILKTAVSVGALGASLLIPGATGAVLGLVLRGASAAFSAVDAVRNGSVLGAIGAIAQGVGVGLGGVAAQAGSKGLETAAKAAGLVARGTQGVNAIQSGNWVGLAGGVLNLAGAAVEGLHLGGVASTGLDKLGQVSQQVSQNLQVAGAVQGVISSSRQLGSAEAALQAALQSGDSDVIAQAQQRVDQARRNRTSSWLGGISAGLDLVGQKTGQQKLSTASKLAGIGTNLSRGDFAGAAAGALGIAANSTDSASFKEFAGLAQAGSNFASSIVAERKAQQGVALAEQALESARRSGNPEALAAAEASLQKARQARNGAAMDQFFSGDTLAQAGQNVADQRAFRQELREQMAPMVQAALDSAQRLEELKSNPRAVGGFKALLEQGSKEAVEAGDALSKAIASGDLGRISAAQQRLALATTQSEERAALLSKVLSPVATVPSALLARLQLKDPELIPVVQSRLRFEEDEAAAASPGRREKVTSTIRFESVTSTIRFPGASEPISGADEDAAPTGNGGQKIAKIASKTLSTVEKTSKAVDFLRNAKPEQVADYLRALEKKVKDLPEGSQLLQRVKQVETLRSSGKLGAAAALLQGVQVLAGDDPLRPEALPSTASAAASAASKVAEVARLANLQQLASKLESSQILALGKKFATVKSLGGVGDLVGSGWAAFQAVQAFQKGDSGTGLGKGLQSVGNLAAGAGTLALATGATAATIAGVTVSLPVVVAVGTALALGGLFVEWKWGGK